MPPKVASVADALKREAEKRPNLRAPSVRLRAKEKGYYGHPVPGIIEAGVEFNHRLAELEVYVEPKKGEKVRTNYGGKPFQCVTVAGTKYILPAWCEDAKQPSSLVEKEEVDETFALADTASPGEEM